MDKSLIKKARAYSNLMLIRSKQITHLKVKGDSNYPFIKDGDEIVIDRIQEHCYKVGQIVVFWNEKEEALFAHRIVFINRKTITTKGDNNWFCDSPTSNNHIYGVVLKINDKYIKNSFPYLLLVHKPIAAYSHSVGILLSWAKNNLNLRLKKPSRDSYGSMIYRIPIMIFIQIYKLLYKLL